MTILLRTERLTLRQFTPDDIENLLDLDNDAEVMRFINGGRPTSRAEVERRLTRLIADYPRLGGLGTWPAEMRASGEFVGWFALRPPPQVGPLVPGPGVAEIGYRLRRAWWGRGLATEGGQALLDLGFRSLGVRRVVAQTMTVNRASRGVMEKLGLAYVRRFHLDWPDAIEGTDEGDVEYALDRALWSAGRKVDMPPDATKPDISR
jgi:RimJ/RimL family protein N-acetyltransferase